MLLRDRKADSQMKICLEEMHRHGQPSFLAVSLPRTRVRRYRTRHLLTAQEIHCTVCLEEDGRYVRLHRWEALDREDGPA